MGSVDLSIIICTFNRSGLLNKCLQALSTQNLGTLRVEIVIVDNGSTDDTKTVAETFAQSDFMSIKYIYDSQKGIGYARNVGLRATLGRYVATLDDDTIPTVEWCATVCQAFESVGYPNPDKIVALGGPIDPIFETGRPGWLTAELEALYAILDLGQRMQLFPGEHHPVQANVAFLRSALIDNPWNEQVVMCEENELFGRLTRKGLKYLYVPEMRVRHFISAKRLNMQWLLNRHFAEGVASRYFVDGTREKIRPLVRSALKLPYAWGRSHFGSEPCRLTFRCRTMQYAGTLAGLLGLRDVGSTAYVSARHNATF